MSPVIEIMDVERARAGLLRRRTWDEFSVPPSLLERNERLFGEPIGPEEAVRRILADVRARGDAALLDWSHLLDGVRPRALRVRAAELDAAFQQVEPGVVDGLRFAAARIAHFHRHQPALSWFQNDAQGTLGQLVRPIQRVGVYVPGGTAPLPSTLLMTAIPAQVAGVPQISIVSPPQPESGLPHPVILVAAALLGLETVYVCGGAQAIAALAYGTESVGRVDKICGPGGLYTVLAKRQLYGDVGIDGLPGPTETMVIADSRADPELVAADLLAQAEHDVLASAILLTPSRTLADTVQVAVAAQLEELDRATTIVASLANRGGIVITDSLAQAFDLANDYAPEHLCLLVEAPWQHLGAVQNAGGLFLGERSFEVLGDYVAGPSHVMPTGGTARFASPVNVNDFLKIVSLIGLNDSALQEIGPTAQALAQAEGLTAHAAAVRRRLQPAAPSGPALSSQAGGA